MGDGLYTAREVYDALRGWGFELRVDEHGVVRGRLPGGTVTLEMRGIIDQLQWVNDQVAELIRREAGSVTAEGLTLEEAKACGERIGAGELELVPPVLYHRKTGLIDVTYREKAKP